MNEQWKNGKQAVEKASKALYRMACQECHFRLELIYAVLVLLLGWYVNLRKWEWVVVSLLIALVLILELFNSVIERLVDLFIAQNDDRVAFLKDLMSGVVLVSAFIALAIGLWIFVPYLATTG
jgi:diacylglycerol kinase